MDKKQRHWAAYLLAAACLWGTGAQADRITLRTTKAPGDTLTLTLNANTQATLYWGDGSTQDVFFNGLPKAIPLVTDTLTLVTETTITSFDATDCGLTTLNLSRATSIEALTCGDNALSTLALNTLRSLKYLDCSNNLLTTLNIYPCSELTHLDCSGNLLETLSLSGNTKLKTLICSENKLEALLLSRQSNLRFLWAQDNALTTLDVSSCPTLKTLLVSDNALTDLTAEDMDELSEVWIDGNEFDTLSLRDVAKLSRLSADRNRLQSLSFHRNYRNVLKYCYLQDNQLAFNSFPYVYNKTTDEVRVESVLMPQAPIALPEVIAPGETLDFSALVKSCAGGSAVNPTVVWKKSGTDEVLEEGTDVTLVNKGRYIFNTVAGPVYGTITAPEYPDVVLTTSVIQVADPTGITDVTEDAGIHIRTAPGALSVTLAHATHLNICNASGMLIAGGNYEAGTYQWQLTPGIYIVNGIKINLP